MILRYQGPSRSTRVALKLRVICIMLLHFVHESQKCSGFCFFGGKIKGWNICTWRSSGGRLDGEQTETASERRAPWATSTLKAGIGQNWSQLAVRWLVRPLKDVPKDEPKETNETMQRPEGGQAGNPAETCSGGSDCQSAVSWVLFWGKKTIWAFVTGKTYSLGKLLLICQAKACLCFANHGGLP